MKNLLKYLKDYKKETFLGPLFKLLEASFELTVPLIIALIIDEAITNSDKGQLITLSLVLVGLGLVGFICAVSAQYFAAKAATGFAEKIRSALFRKIQSFSFSQIDTMGSSTLITRMTSDINQVQSGTNLLLRLFLRSPFIVFGAFVMALTIDTRLSVNFAVTIGVLLVVVFGIMLISMPLYKKVQERLDRVLLSVKENLSGIRVIRAFCREDAEKKQFRERNGELCTHQLKVGRISALLNPLTYVIINFAIIMLISSGALRVDSGELSQGELVALYNYMGSILIELIKLANLIITVTKAFACAGRISKVLDTPTDEKPSFAPFSEEKSAFKVSFEKVSLAYGSSEENSLEDISFDVLPGQTVGIIGATGSGKSSLVNLIPGFYDCTAGQVRIDGRDVKEYDKSSLRERIGTVMQSVQLFKGSIRDNLLWGNPNADEDTLKEALERACALPFVLEKGLDFELEQGGKNLSGGQRQRLSIARALVKKPDILILDDSASALDFATEASLRRAIRTLPFSPTVFIVSQRASSLMHADLILVLDDGRIIARGSHSELMNTCETYREIYKLQFPDGLDREVTE